MVSDTTYCEGEIAAPLTATGTNLLWYPTATGGTGTTIAPTPTTNAAGVQVYWVSQSVSNCESVRSPLTVMVAPAPIAPVVSDTTYCEGEIAVPLTATGTNLLWYPTATGGTGTAIAPTPTTNAAGVQTYWVSQSVSSCESVRSPITVMVAPAPIPPVVLDTTYCEGEIAVPLTATGTNLLWYPTATGGTGTTIAPTPTTTAAGVQVYWVSQSVSSCESVRSPLTVMVAPAPIPPVVSDTTYCEGEIAVPLTATGTNLLWYPTATGGIGTAIAPTPTTTCLLYTSPSPRDRG